MKNSTKTKKITKLQNGEVSVKFEDERCITKYIFNPHKGCGIIQIKEFDKTEKEVRDVIVSKDEFKEIAGML